MKKKVNITIKEYDENANLMQTKDINIEYFAEVKHLEDNYIGRIDSIRENSIVVLWYKSGSEVFNFSELDKLQYTIKNRVPLINIIKFDIPKFIDHDIICGHTYNTIEDNCIKFDNDCNALKIINEIKQKQIEINKAPTNVETQFEEDYIKALNFIAEYKQRKIGIDTLAKEFKTTCIKASNEIEKKLAAKKLDENKIKKESDNLSRIIDWTTVTKIF